MDEFYDLPDFVHVRAHAKEIQVRLSEMPLKNGMYVKAKHIDLEKDQIEFVYYQLKIIIKLTNRLKYRKIKNINL